MFFKKRLWGFILSSSLCLLSCGLKIGEQAPARPVVETKSSACLDASTDTFKLIFKAQASDQELAAAVNCLSLTVQDFIDSVQGESKDYFTASELGYFLNKNIFKKDSKLSDLLLQEIMKIKVSLLGGTAENLQKTELKKLRQYIDLLAPEIIQLNKHMPILTHHWNNINLNSFEKTQQLNAARKDFTQLCDHFFSLFSPQPYEYDINSFLDLIKQVLIFNNSSAEKINSIEKYRSLMVAAKSSLIGEGLKIKNSDWPLVSTALSSGFFILLQKDYFTDDTIYQKNNPISSYAEMAESTLDLIYQLLKAQNKNLTSDQVQKLLNGLLTALDSKMFLSTQAIQDFALLRNALVQNSSSSATIWSPDDFLSLKAKAQSLVRDTGILLGYIDSLQNETLWKKDYTVFTSMEKDFQQTLGNLVLNFEDLYDIKNFKSLLNDVFDSGLIQKPDFFKDYDKYFNILINIKKLVTSTEKTEMSATEIKVLWPLAGRGLFHYLEYQNYLDSVDYENPIFAQNASALVPKVYATLEKVLEINPNGFLKTDHLIQTYSRAYSEFSKKLPLTVASLQVVLNSLWTHILIQPEHRLANNKLPGFNHEALDTLNSYIQFILKSDALSKAILNSNLVLPQNQIQNSVRTLLTQTTNPTDLSLLNEMNVVYASQAPLTVKNNFMKIFDSQAFNYNYHDLQLSNLSRLATRLLTQSYASSMTTVRNLALLKSEMSLSEMQKGFDQFKSVLIELNFLSLKATHFMASRFKEANLFVARSNGDQWMNFSETHDLVFHLISGVFRANKMRDFIAKDCLPGLTTPLKADTAVDEACVLNTFYHYNEGFEFIPEFLKLKTSLDANTNKQFYLNLLVAGGYVDEAPHKVLIEDADRLMHISQYVEMIFALYDTNRDGQLVKEEALRMFPVFKELTRQVVANTSGGSLVSEDELPGAFIYVLKYGSPPSGLIEKFRFLSFVGNESKWIINTNRYDLSVAVRSLAPYLH